MLSFRSIMSGVAFSLVCLGACDQVSDPQTASERPEITPQDFALVPCGPGLETRPCTLAIAGGKRVLFGAPAGIAATLQAQDLQLLDGVMLFSLSAADLEGLDEVRNESWHAGRSEPLLVVGPEGIDEVVTAMNKAFEQSDALRIVEEGIPRGGYDAAILVSDVLPRTGETPAIMFDTGDIVITGATLSGGIASYIMSYAGHEVWAEPCLPERFKNVRTSRDDHQPSDKVFLGGLCDLNQPNWPLTATRFVLRKES